MDQFQDTVTLLDDIRINLKKLGMIKRTPDTLKRQAERASTLWVRISAAFANISNLSETTANELRQKFEAASNVYAQIKAFVVTHLGGPESAAEQHGSLDSFEGANGIYGTSILTPARDSSQVHPKVGLPRGEGKKGKVNEHIFQVPTDFSNRKPIQVPASSDYTFLEFTERSRAGSTERHAFGVRQHQESYAPPTPPLTTPTTALLTRVLLCCLALTTPAVKTFILKTLSPGLHFERPGATSVKAFDLDFTLEFQDFCTQYKIGQYPQLYQHCQGLAKNIHAETDILQQGLHASYHNGR